MRQLIYAVFRIACMTDQREGERDPFTIGHPPLYLIQPPTPSMPTPLVCLSSCIQVKRSAASSLLIFGVQTKLICVFMIMIHESLCLRINISMHLQQLCHEIGNA